MLSMKTGINTERMCIPGGVQGLNNTQSNEQHTRIGSAVRSSHRLHTEEQREQFQHPVNIVTAHQCCDDRHYPHVSYQGKWGHVPSGDLIQDGQRRRSDRHFPAFT